MTAATIWAAEDPCPTCGSVLARADDGTGPVTDECRSCGWQATFETIPDGGQQ
jgi:predicted RNA-binding Zn-ribbon protein involved in translation (DUF1610 family)